VFSDLPFYIAFSIIIGSAVSLDVSGLILSQYLDYSRSEKNGGRKRFRSAWRHAKWHGGLFALYTLIIGLTVLGAPVLLKLLGDLVLDALRFLFWIISQLSWIEITLPDIPIDYELTRAAIVWLFTLITIIFVLDTYREKIAENHNDKHDSRDMLGELRSDVAIILSFVTRRDRSTDVKQTLAKRRINNHLLAAAVAVDMLAMTTLIRFSLEQQANGVQIQEASFSWFLILAIMSVTITVTVFTVATMAAVLSTFIGTFRQ